jgi:hypothetical protein
MPKPISDEITGLSISRQRRYQLRKRRDRKCIRCGQDAVNAGYFCETHRQIHNVLTRELRRKRFDFKSRVHDSESYGFPFSSGRLLYDRANSYLELGRRNSSPAEASEHFRVALVIGFAAFEAYLRSVTDQFEVRFEEPTAPLDERIEYLFKRLSTEPLDYDSTTWAEFKLALKLRDEFERPATRSRINTRAAEKALESIWSLLNLLNTGIYGSRWA